MARMKKTANNGNEGKGRFNQSDAFNSGSPKKPCHPYFIFRKQYLNTLNADEVKKRNRDWKPNKIAQEAWNAMNPIEKEELMKQYKQEWKSYKQSINKVGCSKSSKRNKSSKREKQEYVIRCSPNKVVKLLSEFDEAKKQAIEEIGFGGLLSIKCQSMPHGLLEWLIKNFNPTLCNIKLAEGNVLWLSSRDIELMLGIPGKGPIPVEDDDGIEVDEREDQSDVKRTYKWDELMNELVELQVGDEFKKKFVIFACGSLLTPNKRGEHKTKVWGCLEPVTNIRQQNWAEFVRINLCESLMDVHRNNRKYVGGCIFALMIFYLDRISILNHHVPRTNPHVAAWTDTLISKRISIEIGTHKQYGCGKIEAQCNEENTSSDASVAFPGELFVKVANSGFENIAGELLSIYKAAVTSQKMAIDCQRQIVNVCEFLCTNQPVNGSGRANERKGSDMKSTIYEKGQCSSHNVYKKKRYGESNLDVPWEKSYMSLRSKHVDGVHDISMPGEIGNVSVERDEAGPVFSPVNELEKNAEVSANVSKGSDVKSVGGITLTITQETRRKANKTKEFLREGLQTLSARPTRATKRNVLVPSGEFVISSKAKLTHMEAKIASFAWRKDANEGEVLVDMHGYCLTRGELLSLDIKQWVSSKVIDMYARWMNAKGSKEGLSRFIVEPSAVFKIRDLHNYRRQSDESIFHMLHHHFRCHDSTVVDLSHCQTLLAPICSDNHWFVYSFDIVGQRIQILDSKHATPRARPTSLLGRLMRALGLVLQQMWGISVDFKKFTLQVADVPHQSEHNVYDCGIFTMKYLEHWNGRLGVTITEDNIPKYRKKYVSELMCDERNKRLDYILKALEG